MPVPSETDHMLKEILARLAVIEKQVEWLVNRSDETSSSKSEEFSERSLYERVVERLKTKLEPQWLAQREPDDRSHRQASDITHAVHYYLSNTKPGLKNRLQAICEPISKARHEAYLSDQELLEQYCDYLVMFDSEAARGTRNALQAFLAKERSTAAGEKE